jgi:hopanoid biosynthesis associated protein HpnK
VKSLIVTADDFGLSAEVNDAVEIAHRDGILTAASLMVAAPAAADAVARARRLPRLRVGLHLVLVNGRPILPASQVPDLVGPDGAFLNDMARAGLRFLLRSGARAQLAAEIRAQFEAFRATGLPLDHVNAHRHMHLHPTVAGLVIAIGREFGARAVRIPAEPPAVLAQAEGAPRPKFREIVAAIWARRLARRVRQAGLAANDAVFGIAWSGAMTEARLLALLPRLPEGVSEIYCHPATAETPALAAEAPGYLRAEELAALVSPAVARRVAEERLRLVAFSDLAATA